MRIAVLGANGQLGTDVCRLFRARGDDVVELNHDRVDITQQDAVISAVADARPGMLVNCAAFHHVEKCEADPQRTFAVNAFGARHAALAAQAAGAYLVQISTDYVFDGRKKAPYLETDLPAPLNAYAVSKVAGEHFVLGIAPKSAVLRTSGLYGKSACRGKGLNFVQLMLKLAKERDELRVVDSEVLTPTSTLEVARQIVKLGGSPVYGICHASCEGSCSWHRFAQEIFAIAGLKVNLQVARPDEFPMKVPRPTYSVLENAALKAAGVNTFRPWQDALREYMA